MSSRKKPGPKKRRVEVAARSHKSHPPFPLLSNYLCNHVEHVPNMQTHKMLTSKQLYEAYMDWLMCLGERADATHQKIIEKPYVEQLIAENNQKSFTIQALKFAKLSGFWDRQHLRGPFEVQKPNRRLLEPWRRTPMAFLNHNPADGELKIERANSFIPLAGQGMFSTAFLYSGEVVAEYKGTFQRVNLAELQRLEAKHEDDGSGIIELKREKSAGSPAVSIEIINPYLFEGVEKTSDEVVGIWANHAKRSLSCNLRTTQFRIRGVPHFMLLAACNIPAQTELCWDYGFGPDNPAPFPEHIPEGKCIQTRTR